MARTETEHKFVVDLLGVEIESRHGNDPAVKKEKQNLIFWQP